MPCSTDLHEYQREAVQFLLDHPRALLVLDMGLGKTAITLTAIQQLLDGYDAMRVLVVAPKRVAISTWPAEIELWDHVTADYQLLTGSKKQREEACRSGAPIHIINVDNLLWLVGHCGKDWPYDMVVIDESSMFKSSSTRRFKSLKKRLPMIDRVVLLTGTPAPNSLLDLWSQVFLLDSGERMFRTFSAFRQHYFSSDYMGYQWEIKAGAEEDIYDRISDLCLRMDAAAYLDTPERVDVTVPVQLPATAWAQYRELERHQLLPLAEGEVVAAQAAVLVGKLLQATSGALYYTDDDGVQHYETVHDAKLDALEDIVVSAAGRPVLVFYQFRSDLDRLRERFPQAETLDADGDVIERWNRGEVPMLLAHPKSSGHGLNLQHGGSIAVWFALTYSLEQYQQANARLHRQGQKRTTVIHHLVATGTVDEDVVAVLQRKDATQENLFDALKKRAEAA